jgi:hypothetical protein
MSLMQLIYTSTLTGRDETLLDPIHLSAVQHNRKSGVTGMLLYFNGAFMQVLEGERDAVMVTYQRIRNDLRHQNSRVLVEEAISTRHFPTWSMGLCRVGGNDLLRLPQFDSVVRNGFDSDQILARPGIALSMLQLFGQSAI